MRTKSTTIWLDSELLETSEVIIGALRSHAGFNLTRHQLLKEITEQALSLWNIAAIDRMPWLDKELGDHE
tara:strand:- start:1742 stop:1951 length:210 start_codon:yes stop_codon:yes gene_type:complete